jgi:hypothetical protein
MANKLAAVNTIEGSFPDISHFLPEQHGVRLFTLLTVSKQTFGYPLLMNWHIPCFKYVSGSIKKFLFNSEVG